MNPRHEGELYQPMWLRIKVSRCLCHPVTIYHKAETLLLREASTEIASVLFSVCRYKPTMQIQIPNRTCGVLHLKCHILSLS